MKELFAIFQQWLFENLVDQTQLTDFKRIHYAVDPFLEDKKDYIVLSFNTFGNNTLRPEIEETDTDREITEEKIFTLTIQYVGFDAFAKLNDVMDKIKVSNNAHLFLQSKNIAVETISITNVSDLIGDNIIESASMDCKVYYTTLSFDKNIDEDIKAIDMSKILN